MIIVVPNNQKFVSRWREKIGHKQMSQNIMETTIGSLKQIRQRHNNSDKFSCTDIVNKQSIKMNQIKRYSIQDHGSTKTMHRSGCAKSNKMK